MLSRGQLASAAEAVARAMRANRTYEPKPNLSALYAEKTSVYTDVYPTLVALSRKW